MFAPAVFSGCAGRPRRCFFPILTGTYSGRVDRTEACSILERPRRLFRDLGRASDHRRRKRSPYPTSRPDASSGAPPQTRIRTCIALGLDPKSQQLDGAYGPAHHVCRFREERFCLDITYRQQIILGPLQTSYKGPRSCSEPRITKRVEQRTHAARDQPPRGPLRQRATTRSLSLQGRQRVSHLFPLLPSVSQPHEVLRSTHLQRMLRADQAAGPSLPRKPRQPGQPRGEP